MLLLLWLLLLWLLLVIGTEQTPSGVRVRSEEPPARLCRLLLLLLLLVLAKCTKCCGGLCGLTKQAWLWCVVIST